MTTQLAINCFEENIDLIDSDEDPVAYNLNVGLYNLSRALQALERKVDQIQQ